MVYFLLQDTLLVPGVQVKFTTRVESVNNSGLADVIRVVVLRKKSQIRFLSP